MLEHIKHTSKDKSLYLCACGTVFEAQRHNVNSGNTKSCGCLRKLPYAKKHGYAETKVYRTWKSLKARCNGTSAHSKKYYADRGITYCERWEKFENFLADMGEPPSPESSIERIDNNGPYCKENCCWATREVQANNTRLNVKYTYKGKTQTVGRWARELGLHRQTLVMRLARGATVEEAFSQAVKQDTLYAYKGKEQTLNAWATELGMCRKTLANRLNAGIDFVTAIETKGYLTKARYEKMAQQ